MPDYKKVVYIEDPEDAEITERNQVVNKDWDPIFWLIEVLVGPENLLHNDMVPGILKKMQRLEELDKYFKEKSYHRENDAEILLNKVIEHNHGLIPKEMWLQRAYEIEDGTNHWDIVTGDPYIKYAEEE